MSSLAEVLTPTEEQKIHTPEQPWSDSFAGKIVKADFATAENYRRMNHDTRWALADQLYLGYQEQRYWKGSPKVPRSSLGMFLVFEQVETLLPRIIGSLFGDQPPFEVGPQPGTTVKEASDVRDLMLWQFEIGRQHSNQSIREVARRALKSGFLYGNGIVEIYWMEWVRKLRKLYRQQIADTQMHPLYGVPMPTGQMKTVIGERKIERRDAFPCWRNVSIKDFFIDPNNETPQVQTSRYAMKRTTMAVDELDALRNTEGYKIPPKNELLDLARDKPSAQSDQSKQWGEDNRGITWDPSQDSSVDPASHGIEVICAWYKDRNVWMLNREVVAYNSTNEYGFIPLYNVCYTDVLDRFYGASIADVNEGEQRLQAGIINLRNDNLALNINGTLVKKRGGSLRESQLQTRPNRIIEVENPKTDLVFDRPPDITQQAYIEVTASDLRAQKRTGISDMMAGLPATGGNSALRTAQGVSATVEAGSSRVLNLLQTIEDTWYEPMLSAHHYMNTQFLDPEELLRIMNPAGKEVEIDPIAILNSEVLFTMRASSKMKSRMALIQMFEPLMNILMNPNMVESLAQKGYTVDMGEILQIIADASGYKARGEIIRPMTPQEKQAHAQPKPEENLKLQMQRERMVDLQKLEAQKQQGAMTQEQMKQQGELKKETAKIALSAALEPEDEADAD